MKIVIDIPDQAYNMLLSDQKLPHDLDLEYLIMHGTPLPRERGRLMILSEDILKENQIDLEFSCQKWISEVGLSNATVAIVKADREDYRWMKQQK